MNRRPDEYDDGDQAEHTPYGAQAALGLKKMPRLLGSEAASGLETLVVRRIDDIPRTGGKGPGPDRSSWASPAGGLRAELGDKTQLATLTLVGSGKSSSPGHLASPLGQRHHHRRLDRFLEGR